MAETPNEHEQMTASIRETRVRLGTRLARTADHVQVLVNDPSAAREEARDGGVVGRAIKTAGAARRANRAWSHARSTGVVFRATIGAASVLVAAVLAATRKRR